MKILAIFLFALLTPLNLSCQTFDEWVDLSFKYLSDGDLPAAEAALVSAMRQEPSNPLNTMLLTNLGTIQRRQGKYDEALISYTAAMGNAPESITLLSARAELFTEMNRPENAITDYSAILQMNNQEDALYRRGLLYLQIKNYGSAQADFERILEINPKTYYGRVGIVSLCKLRGEYDEAERIYFYLMEKFPEQADLYAGRAELYLLMNRPGRAMTDINRAIRLQGENPNPYLYIIRSRIKEMQFEKKGAEEDRIKALESGYRINLDMKK
ncbi:MAG: tetratricopeptide repeat protein [Dysgonamonadaceae bacterium]|jgi:tetratricopeptide (TPR) repeat protein|nr:tetratricopeptide repeat protein [Dysgonamonadaceae bacterium]